MTTIPGKPTDVPIDDREVLARFWAKVDRSGACYRWTGHVTRPGYGRWTWQSQPKRAAYAHRVAWEIAHGPVPPGLVIDHICRKRRCVNVEHMRLVTVAENVLCGASQSAANAAKTHCKHGHEFTPANTYLLPGGGRHCRACKRRRDGLRTKTTTPTNETEN